MRFSNLRFINLTPGQSYTVTPISQFFTFETARRTFDNIGARHGNLNFTGTLIPQPGVCIIQFTQPQTQPGEPWSAVLQNCLDVNNTPACDRITMSGAFFGAPEFQLKAFYVFHFYKVAFGRLPLYAEIVSDMSSVAGATEAEVYARRAQLATAFSTSRGSGSLRCRV